MDRFFNGCLGVAFVVALLIGGVLFLIGKGVSAGTHKVQSLYGGLVDGNQAEPDTIVFSGRISQGNNQRWLNNRLVLAYAQDAEVGRVQSNVASYRQVVQSPTDGIFQLAVRNAYRVNAGDLKICQSTEFSQKTLYCWLGDVREDASGFNFRVPEKRLDLAIRVIPGDYATLPEEMKEPGITGLSDGNIVIAQTPAEKKGLFGKLGDAVASLADTQEKSIIRKVFYRSAEEKVNLPDQSQTVDLDNCAGSEVSRQILVDSKTIVQEYEIGLGVQIPIPAEVLVVQLGVHGNYRNKKITSRTARQEVAARPGTHVIYKVRWEEVWASGTAIIETPLGPKKVPFRLRKDVQYLIKSFSRPCPTATAPRPWVTALLSLSRSATAGTR